MKIRRLARSLAALTLALACPVLAQKNVVQPGDPVIASSSNSPGSEGVANAIDGKTTKYLNFDSRTPDPIKPSGFIVTPSVGVTWVTGMRIQSANDAQERDPKTVILSGSNADTPPAWDDAAWEQIATIDVPDFTARFQFQDLAFSNFKAYKHYQWKVTQTRTSNGCCMQVAEVELIGRTLPQDITQPGDPIVASSSNSPGSEGVANVIDNKTTKYLNFDSRTPDPIKPSGFVVSPQFGRSVVLGMTIQSANDAQERDPKTVIVSGSNADTAPAWDDASWETVQTVDVPDFTARFQTQTFLWNNVKPYKHYQWKVTQTRTSNGCCMQVAEVELLGTPAPKDVTQPGDTIIASSSNSPGSEGVANAIDNKTTKYLNFDSRTPDPIKPSGFIVTPSVGATTLTGMTIQSANDAQERDPKTVILSGSNADTAPAWDDAAWEQIATIDVPDFTARFQTQEMFFNNSKSYKHYQWKVTQTRTSNGCCMQVAEVELLAVQEGADCTKARFVAPPVNQPVLLGSKATFQTIVNGPWPLQWTKNGQPIPGATGTSFQTGAIATADDATNKYAVTIVGCETSQEVQAVIFTPNATKSVAVSFSGGGANGAPSEVLDDDIVGVHLQAHWNNAVINPDGSELATPNSGSLDPSVDPAQALKDSDGNVTDFVFSWDTGGAWGSGTGENTGTDRMLNGLVGRNGPGSQNTFTFANVPAGTHSVIVYSVSPPLQFQRISYNIGNTTYYMRALTPDEYNAAPGFYRGSSTAAADATVGDFVRFDNVQPDGSGQIILTTETLDSSDRQTGVNGIQLLLNTGGNVGLPPAITVEPQPVVAAAGATATLRVTATGTGLTYQWRKAGRNIANGGNISGAQSSTLTISDFSAADVGVYSVAVFNSNGSVISKNATASLSTYNINDALVGYWKLDETSGTTAANSAPGAAANSVGVVNGNPNWVAGQINNAFSFDGSTFIYVTNYPKATKAISGSAWVNIDPATAGDVAIFRNQQGDMRIDGGTTRIVGQFEVGLTFDGNTGELHPMAAVGLGPNIARATGTTAFTTGTWHNIAFTADGAQLRVYVDGAQVAVVDYLADINPADTQYLSMGVQLNLADPMDPTSLGPDPANPKTLVGQLDDVAIWNRALTAQEVSLAYQAGVAHQPVTSVIVPPPPTNPTLTQSVTGNTITLTFSQGSKLQATTALAPGATWSDVATTSPYSEQMTAGIKFFRAVAP